MHPTLTVALLWLAFAVSHLGLSSLRLRGRLVARLGERPFLGLYSLLSFAFFVPLVWTYFSHKHTGPWLWVIPSNPVLTWVLYIVMGIAFVFVVASLAQPSPASIVPGKADPRGVFRLARHPLFMGIALFGLTHLVPNGSTTDVVFFGGFVVFTLLGAWHQDQRKLATGPSEYREFHARTPFLPFTGRETWTGLRELSPAVIGLGVALTVIVRYFHASWFGG